MIAIFMMSLCELHSEGLSLRPFISRVFWKQQSLTLETGSEGVVAFRDSVKRPGEVQEVGPPSVACFHGPGVSTPSQTGPAPRSAQKMAVGILEATLL